MNFFHGGNLRFVFDRLIYGFELFATGLISYLAEIDDNMAC